MLKSKGPLSKRVLEFKIQYDRSMSNIVDRKIPKSIVWVIVNPFNASKGPIKSLHNKVIFFPIVHPSESLSSCP